MIQDYVPKIVLPKSERSCTKIFTRVCQISLGLCLLFHFVSVFFVFKVILYAVNIYTSYFFLKKNLYHQYLCYTTNFPDDSAFKYEVQRPKYSVYSSIQKRNKLGPLKSHMAKSLPLYEKTNIKRPTQKVLDIAIFILLVSLDAYRVLLMYNHGFSYLQTIAFLCEFWFSFVWFLAIILKWNPVHFETYPRRLLKR